MMIPALLRRALAVASALLLVNIAHAQVNVLMNRYDPGRTAANLNETILNTSNVVAGKFGKLGSYPVDGVIYAQPLYVAGLIVKGAKHNVLFIATMHNVVYAFDADQVGSAPLWKLDLRAQGYTPWKVSQPVVTSTYGIFSTPVIDLEKNRLFLVAHSEDSSGVVHFTLFSLNIQTGAINASHAVTVSVPAVGAAAGVSLSPASNYAQRPALALADGELWVAFGSRPPGDNYTPWYGFITTYNPSTLAQTSVFATSRSNGNSVWQSGGGPAVDASDQVYFTTANGGAYDGVYEFPDTLLKLKYGTEITVSNWYTPDYPGHHDNYVFMNDYDLDLSVCGPMLIPNTDLVALGSKTADVFVLHKGNLGHLTHNDPQLADFFHVGTVEVPFENDRNRIVGLAYWQQANGGYLYAWPGLDTLHSYSLNPSTSTFTAVAAGTLTLAGEPSAALSVSANGTTAGSGILWASHVNSTTQENFVGEPGLLHAYDAQTLKELWNSDQVSSDYMGTLAKYVPPVVVNGKVYVANSATLANPSAGSVTVFGLLQ